MESYNAKFSGNHITGHFKENTTAKRQRQWNDEDRERWMARLIGHKTMDWSKTWKDELLRGHGYFRKHLHKIGNICTVFTMNGK